MKRVDEIASAPRRSPSKTESRFMSPDPRTAPDPTDHPLAGFPGLSGKVVAVTGGATGIGAAASTAFLAAGANVVVHYHAGEADARALAKSAPDRVATVAADLIQPEAAASVVETALTRFGCLDVLVNNAGGMVARRPFAEVDPAFFDAVLDLNIRSLLAVTHAALPALRATHGAIVHVTSISARTGGSPGSSIYSAAKAFVSSLVRTTARELAADGVRVNAVSPGTIDTAFHQRHSTPEKLVATANAVPLGRLGTPEDCAGAFLFLASTATAAYVTGQIVEVNGGQFMP